VSSGSVGVGTTSPFAKLSVNGDANGTIPLFVVASSTSSYATNTAFLIDKNGNVGIGLSNPSYVLDVAGLGHFTGLVDAANFVATSSSATSTFAGGFSVAGTAGLTVLQNGKVGIGTTAPGDALQVAGNITSGSTSGGADGGILNLATKDSSTSGEVRFWQGGSVIAKIFSTMPGGNSGSLSFLTSSPNHAPATRMFIDNIGQVGIGLSNPSYLLHVSSTTNAAAVAAFTNSNGTCRINPTTTSLDCSSDSRLKKDVTDLSSADSLSKLTALQPVAYHWNGETSSDPTHFGLIAQAVEPIFPELVSTDANGYKSIAYTAFTPLMIDAIKELNLKVDALGGTQKVTISGGPLDTLGYAAGQIVDGVVHFGQVVVDKITAKLGIFDKLCVGSTCVTETELKALLEKNGIAPAGEDTQSDPTPADLGSNDGTITDPNPGNSLQEEQGQPTTPAGETTDPVATPVTSGTAEPSRSAPNSQPDPSQGLTEGVPPGSGSTATDPAAASNGAANDGTAPAADTQPPAPAL